MTSDSAIWWISVNLRSRNMSKQHLHPDRQLTLRWFLFTMSESPQQLVSIGSRVMSMFLLENPPTCTTSTRWTWLFHSLYSNIYPVFSGLCLRVYILSCWFALSQFLVYVVSMCLAFFVAEWAQTALVWCAWFPGGWCGPDGFADRQQRASSWRQELLPSTSPYDIVDDGPTSVNLNSGNPHENTTSLSLLWIASMFVKDCKTCRYTSIVSSTGIRDSSMYVATTLVLTSPFAIKLVSWQRPSFHSSPKLQHVSILYFKRLFVKISEDGFAVPLQLVFLPFLTEFLMKGLVKALSGGYFHLHCIEWFPLACALIDGGRAHILRWRF